MGELRHPVVSAFERNTIQSVFVCFLVFAGCSGPVVEDPSGTGSSDQTTVPSVVYDDTVEPHRTVIRVLLDGGSESEELLAKIGDRVADGWDAIKLSEWIEERWQAITVGDDPTKLLDYQLLYSCKAKITVDGEIMVVTVIHEPLATGGQM